MNSSGLTSGLEIFGAASMKKSTLALVTKAQAVFALDSRMGATMLANAYRAASVADQKEILVIAMEARYSGMFACVNNTLVVKG